MLLWILNILSKTPYKSELIENIHISYASFICFPRPNPNQFGLEIYIIIITSVLVKSNKNINGPPWYNNNISNTCSLNIYDWRLWGSNVILLANIINYYLANWTIIIIKLKKCRSRHWDDCNQSNKIWVHHKFEGLIFTFFLQTNYFELSLIA